MPLQTIEALQEEEGALNRLTAIASEFKVADTAGEPLSDLKPARPRDADVIVLLRDCCRHF